MLNLKDLGNVILSFETYVWVAVLLSWNSIVPQVISLVYFVEQLLKQTTTFTLDFFGRIYQVLSIPLILVYKLVQVSLLLVLWPGKQILIPGGVFAFHILRHLLVEPSLLCIRTLFYAFFGIPLRPLCYLLGINDLSAEHIMELKPQLEFFVVTTIHYIVASLMIGAITGIFTGYNMVFTRYLLGGSLAKPIYTHKRDISTPAARLREANEARLTQKQQLGRKLASLEKKKSHLSQTGGLDLSVQELGDPLIHDIDNNTNEDELEYLNTDEEKVSGNQDKRLLSSEGVPSSKESTIRYGEDQRTHPTHAVGTDLFEQRESVPTSEQHDEYRDAKVDENIHKSSPENSKINILPEKEIKEEYPTGFVDEAGQRMESTRRDNSETSIIKDDVFSLVGDIADDEKTMNTQVSFTEKGIKREE